MVLPPGSVVKPLNDDREYRIIVLENGLKALLISDPRTDKAAAALDVNVGSFSDPDELLGLAHFTEHMLFFASEKFPEEDAYTKFISAQGGKANAYTTVEDTNYQFDVNHEHLESALDRFAQFFICPLISEDGTDREVKAVDSEHSKNLNTDGWRLLQLWRHLSSRSHVFSRFTSGNIKTLGELPKSQGIVVHEAVRKFYAENYCANLMKLSVCGRNSLDELERLVTSQFSAVKSQSLKPKEFAEEIFEEDQKGILVKVVPQMDGNNLVMQWSVPPTWKVYRYAPSHYVSHLLGDEGVGSAFALLKDLGYATGLSAGEGGMSFRNRSIFTLQVELTEKGHANVAEVLNIVFNYIDLIKAEGGINENTFNELKALDEMRFNYRDKSDPFNCVRSTAYAMQHYADVDVLKGGIPAEYNPEEIRKVVKELTPANLRLMWVSKSFQDAVDSKEPWYGTQYSQGPIPAEWLQQWEKPEKDERLHIPLSNPFIPTDFDLVEATPAVKEPAVLVDEDLAKIWHKTDVSFGVPKAVIYLAFESPKCYSCPEDAVLTKLFVSLVSDYLNELAYPAELAGLGYSVSNTTTGISVNVSGYSHKIGKLLDSVLEEIFNFSVKKERFDVLHEQVKKDFQNMKYMQPYERSMYTSSQILELRKWSVDEYMSVIDVVGPTDLEGFVKKFCSRVYMRGLVMGNISVDGAKGLARGVLNRIKEVGCRPLFPSERMEKRVIRVPRGQTVFAEEGPNPENDNSSVSITYQIGQDDVHMNALGELAVHIGQREAFTQLRTIEQLGYIVSMMFWSDLGVRSVRFVIQSNAFSAQHLDNRIEAFIKFIEGYMKEMSAKDFSDAVNELVKAKLEKPKRLPVKAARWWKEIVNGTMMFDRPEKEAEAVKGLTIEQVLEFVSSFVMEGPQRMKLGVHVRGAAERAKPTNEEENCGQNNVVKKSDISDYKRKCEVFPSIC
ncbi:hypothetical protein BSKO_01356 [Bryopsis sp. KO-2023]|nr:hypothetical protein BSKO_01356 [Bryopsis sp. KO-2023]